MREMEQMALSYLGRNPILCMDMVEALRRGDGVVSAVRTDGVLISIPRSGPAGGGGYGGSRGPGRAYPGSQTAGGA